MKKLILGLGLFTLVSLAPATSTAENTLNVSIYQSGDEYDAKVKTATEKLGLSKDQQVKYKDYLIRKDKDKKELMDKYRDSPDAEKKAAQQKFKDKYNAEMKKILTAEQLKKLESK